MALVSQLNLRLSAALTAALDLVSAAAPLTVDKTIELASGTGADQADKIFSDRRTLAASASEELDLAGGLTDALGTALTFVKLKALLIIAAVANTNNVVVGGAAANGFQGPFGAANDTIAVPPGGMLLLVAPAAAGLGTVTASTGDLLKIANSGGTTGVTYDIVAIGTSA